MDWKNGGSEAEKRMMRGEDASRRRNWTCRRLWNFLRERG